MDIIDDHKKRQLEFIGHILRKNGFEELILTWCVNGKRSREDRERIIPYKPK